MEAATGSLLLRRTRWRLKDALVSSAIAIPIAFWPAQAQPSTDESETVFVTAQRRQTKILKTPSSIAAVGSADLELKDITNVKEVMAQVPGVTVGSNFGQTIIGIRGISTTDGRSDSSIALYIDGIYAGRQFTPNLSYLDLARVEVLRGPQGALYGRNATGGVISYISKAPTDEVEGSAKILAGSYGRWRSETVLSGPVSDTLSLRVAAFAEKRDGYYENILTGQTLGDHNDWGGRFSARWTPTSDLTIDLKIAHAEASGTDVISSAPAPIPTQAYALVPALATAIVSTEPFKIAQNEYGRHQVTRSTTVTGIINWDISDTVTLTSQTAYTDEKDSRSGIDSDTTSLDLARAGITTGDTAFQQDLYVNADVFEGRLHTLTGISYFQEDYFNYGVTELARTVPYSVLPIGTVGSSKLDQDTTSFAIFTDNTYSVTDSFRLNFGVRANWDEKEVVRTGGTSLPALPGYPTPNLPAAGPVDPATGKVTTMVCRNYPSEAKWDSTVFKGGAEYDVNDDNMLYASYNEGFKAGGFNGVDCSDPFNPEDIESFEIGAKGRLFNNRLTYSISAYHFDYSNLQVNLVVGTTILLTNAGKASGNGIDLSLAAELSDEFSADLNVGFIDAKYDDYCSPQDSVAPGAFPTLPGGYPLDCVIPRSNPAKLGTQLAGTALNRAPKVQGTFGLTYNNNIAGVGELTLRGEVYFTSDVVLRAYKNDPGSMQPGYTLGSVYASLALESAPGVTISGFVKNISDEKYMVYSQNIQLLNTYVVWGDPRTFGVELSLDF